MSISYPITSTFIDEISIDIESQNWSTSDWKKDLEAMRSVGIDTIVFIRGGLNGKCIYPSKRFPTIYTDDNDLLGYILNEAEKLGINVYIGMYMPNGNWDNGNYDLMKDLNTAFVDEVMERYGHHKNFIGWYLPLEVCKEEFNIIETVNALKGIIKEKTPDKRIFWCSLFRTRILEPNDSYSPEKTYEVWDHILSSCGQGIDCIAFNEGTSPLNEYEDYLKATKKAAEKYGIEYWANIETFDRDPRNRLLPTDIETLKRKIEIASRQCVKLNTFEFSHFMSPNSMYEAGRKLFEDYKSYYK